jgi:hypothetical protein
MAQPEVQVEGAEAQPQAPAAQDQLQANVQYQGEAQQAQVEVQMEDPEIRIEQAEAQVDVTRGAPEVEQPARQQAAAQQEPTTAAGIASQGEVSTPQHQVRQAIDEAQMALQQDDIEAARRALDDAQQSLQQVAGQAGDDAPAQLDEVEQSIRQARAALAQADVQAAQQALEDAKVPMQEAMLQPEAQQQRSGQPAQGEPGAVTAAGAPQQEHSGAAAVGSASPLAQMPASEVVGQDVVNEQGDTVAEIVDLVKRDGSEDLFAVLSVGGFLGIGEKQVAMPLDRFAIGQDQEIILGGVTQDEVKNMQAYEDDGSYQSVSR